MDTLELSRLLRIFGRAVELFEGDAEKAGRWLRQPRAALGGVTPLNRAKTSGGAESVEAFIWQLEQGIAV